MEVPVLELVGSGYDDAVADGAVTLVVRTASVVPAMLYLAIRSFEEARHAPRPVSDLPLAEPVPGPEIERPDAITADDLLAAMVLREDGLYVELERLHGRELFTSILGRPDGTVEAQIRHRGRAPLRWLEPAKAPVRPVKGTRFFDAAGGPLDGADAWEAALAGRRAGVLFAGYAGGNLPPAVIGALDRQPSPGPVRVRGGRIGDGTVDLWVAAEDSLESRVRIGVLAPGLGSPVRTWLGGGASPSAARGRAEKLREACLELGLDPEESPVRDVSWRLLSAAAELVRKCLSDGIETAVLVVHTAGDDDVAPLARAFGIEGGGGLVRGPKIDGVALWWLGVAG